MDQQPTQPIPPTPPPPTQSSFSSPHKSTNFIDRAKNILITPKPEWEIIEKESSNNVTVYTTYVLPMLLVGAFASFIGFGLIGVRGFTEGVGGGAIRGLVYVVYTSLILLGMAGAVELLAPSFGAEKNWTKSFKLAAYSMTAAYLGAIWWLFPALWILVLLFSLYSLYALYVGIGIMKKTTADKQVAYFAVVLLITVVLAILLSLLMAEIVRAFQPNPYNQFRNYYR